MNPASLPFLKMVHYDNGGSGLDLVQDAKWLQMVIPPQELQYLRVAPDDGIVDRSQNWFAHESPF